MGYTPENNPYIPGDPYSYDLKWIVDEIKKAIAMYEPLDANFQSLYNYVHDYFNNLDLSAEVSAKIDKMVQDGEFAALIQPFFDEYKDVIDAIVNNMQDTIGDQNIEIAQLKSRMDSFTSLSVGSTTGDAELMDARIAYDSIEFANAGDAIRGQTEQALTGIRHLGAIVNGTVDSLGNFVNSSTRLRFKTLIPVRKNDILRFTPGANAEVCIISRFNTSMVWQADYTITEDWIAAGTGYIAVIFRHSNGSQSIAPTDYDAVTYIEPRDNNILRAYKYSDDPMGAINFSVLTYAKGSYSGTDVIYPQAVFTAKDLTEYNNAATQTQTSYTILSYLMGTKRITELASGQHIDDIYLMIKSNKNITVRPRLSSNFDWAGTNSVAAASSVTLKKGINLINPIFYYDHQSSYGPGNDYAFLVLELNGKWNDLEFEVTMVKGEALLSNLIEIIPPLTTDLLFWGDSLVAGAGGGGTTFPQVCANELGISYMNCGVGGEDANTIAARQGGNNIIIPAGSINGTYSELKDVFGSTVAPLLQGSGAGSASYVYINGQRCSISYGAGVYTISGYTGTSAADCYATFEGSTFLGDVTIIFIGQNGATVSGLGSLDARISIIDSMIAHIHNKKYVVMGLTSGNDSTRTAEDRKLLAKYGNNFFPSRRLLVENGLAINNLTPTSQDTADIATGTVPSSLIDNGVHLNAYGYTALGKLLANKIQALGYV